MDTFEQIWNFVDRFTVVGQCRLKEDNVLHVQVQGNPVNRDYGYAFDVRLLKWTLPKLEKDSPLAARQLVCSLADSDKKYLPCLIEFANDSQLVSIRILRSASLENSLLITVHPGLSDELKVKLMKTLNSGVLTESQSGGDA